MPATPHWMCLIKTRVRVQKQISVTKSKPNTDRNSHMYTTSGKSAALFLPLTLPNTDLFSKFCHQQTYQWICSTVTSKHPTTAHMRRYITLWNVGAQNSLCFVTDRSKLPCKTQLFDTVAEKCSCSDVCLCHLVHWWKTLVTMATAKSTHIMTNRNNQEKGHCGKMPIHMWSTVGDGFSQRVVDSLILVDPTVKVSEAFCNMMLLQQFLPSYVTARANSSFSMTLHEHLGHLKKSTFLPLTSRDVDTFLQKVFQVRITINFVNKIITKGPTTP